MMQRGLIPLFLLSAGFLCVCVCSREYVLVQEYKTWAEAQDFCRVNSMDPASAETQDDWSRINSSRAGLQLYVWIGLYDDVQSWHWSFQDEAADFLWWDYDQPNNLNGRQFCVNMRSDGYWWDEDCNSSCSVLCQSSEGSPVLLSDSLMSWDQAQIFCRGNYSDLFTVRSQEVNKRLSAMIRDASRTCAWIGLHRDSWKWTGQSGSELFSSLPWALGQPDNANTQDSCGALDLSGLIADEPCSRRYYFICQTSTGHLKQQVLRLELKAGADPNAGALTAAVLSQVQQKLREQGLATDVKVSWRRQENGRVFQKIHNTSTGMKEEL